MKERKDIYVELIINNSSEMPIYEQITSQIKNYIITGELKSGDALPSLRFLAKELRISVITTKRAYEELENQGFIESVPGKGSFVANKSSQILREEQLRLVEEELLKVVDIAIKSNISLEELLSMIQTLYIEK